MSDNDALELMKSGNKEALARIKTAVQTGDTCDPKHQRAINASLLPFAERSFEVQEMTYAKLNHSVGSQMEIPIPFTGKTVKGEPADILRLALVASVCFLIYMSFSDKEERMKVRDDLKKFQQSELSSCDVPKTVMMK